GREAADEAITLPAGEQLAVVNHESGGGDDRVPGKHRWLEVRAGVVVGDPGAAVVVAFGHDRVAVVGAALDAVEFVAAPWTHLVRPQLAGVVEGQPEDVAVAERPCLRSHAAGASKRIAVG